MNAKTSKILETGCTSQTYNYLLLFLSRQIAMSLKTAPVLLTSQEVEKL